MRIRVPNQSGLQKTYLKKTKTTTKPSNNIKNQEEVVKEG